MSQLEIGYSVDDRGIVVRFLVNLLCSNPQKPNMNEGQCNVLFNGHQVLFLLGGASAKGHTSYCGLRRGSHVEKSQ